MRLLQWRLQDEARARYLNTCRVSVFQGRRNDDTVGFIVRADVGDCCGLVR